MVFAFCVSLSFFCVMSLPCASFLGSLFGLLIFSGSDVLACALPGFPVSREASTQG